MELRHNPTVDELIEYLNSGNVIEIPQYVNFLLAYEIDRVKFPKAVSKVCELLLLEMMKQTTHRLKNAGILPSQELTENSPEYPIIASLIKAYKEKWKMILAVTADKVQPTLHQFMSEQLFLGIVKKKTFQKSHYEVIEKIYQLA